LAIVYSNFHKIKCLLKSHYLKLFECGSLAENKPAQLKRSLGLWSSVAINVGAIIGGGIFVVTGIVAGYAGSALIISMIIAGVIAFITASSFAKLTSWLPVEGSVYEYGRRLISPFWGFQAGWMWVLANTFTGAAVSLGFAYYLSAAFPALPANFVAAALCLAFTALNLVGAKESASVNNVFVAVKLAVLGLFVAFGLLHVNSGNFLPFAPLSSGVLYGSFFFFFAYGGFARIGVVAEEVKDAKRNVPKAMLYSLGISMVIYVLVGVVAVGLAGSGVLAGSNSPLAAAIGTTGNSWALQIVAVGGLVATASVLLTAILGVSRMMFSMSRGGDFPAVLSKISRRFCTPYFAILVSGAVMAVLVLFVDLTRVVAISTFSLLFNYSITNIAAYKLKDAQEGLRRFVPIAGLATCLMLLAFIFFASLEAFVIGIVFLFVGTAIYFGKKRLVKG
jgi:basic amino acid/polyamine antiporter, APA family